MQDTFACATHLAYAAGRPSAARDDMVSCIQERIRNLVALTSARFCARARRRFSPISRIREMHLVR